MSEKTEPPETVNAPTTLLVRAVAQLIAARWWLFAIVVLLTALAWPVSQRLSFDQSIESLYANDDPHLREFVASRSLFGGDEFLIVAYSDPDLFEPNSNALTNAAHQRITALARKLSDVPGVIAENTQHLAHALRFSYNRDRIRELATGTLLGNDGSTTGIVLRLQPETTALVPRGETIAQVRLIAASQNPPAVVVGEPAQIHDMFRYVENDGRRLFGVSIGLLAVVLLLLLRRLRWVILPVLVVLVSIVWTEALLVLSQMRLSMVSSMLNSLITVIGVATTMHLMLHFRELHRDRSAHAALQETLVELARPIWWTIATTAFGFAVLLSSSINPVASFGTMMAIGSLLVLVVVVMLSPICILAGRMSPEPPDNAADRRVGSALGKITLWVELHPRRVILSAAVSLGFASFGFLWLRVETDFSKNFRANSPIIHSLTFVESRLGGAGSWEVNFPAPPQLTIEYLDKVRAFAEAVRKEFGVSETQNTQNSSGATHGKLSKVISLTDGLDIIPDRIFFATLSVETRLALLDSMQSDFVKSLYNADSGRMRFILRAYERQPSETKLRLISGVQQMAQEAFDVEAKQVAPLRSGAAPQPLKIAGGGQSTGLFVLLAFLIESLMADQWTSFLISTIGITLMLWAAFNSLPMGLIALAPNLIPNVLVFGLMGWIGLPLNIATAMIACVSMGLTVDSSIIYIDSYYRERRRGHGVYSALHAAHQSVGRVVVYTNMALVAGFSVLALSHFIPLVYFGLLVSLSMIGGLIGNLVFLPLLIGWWDSRILKRVA